MKNLSNNTTIFSPFWGDAAGRGGLKKLLLLSAITLFLLTSSYAQQYGWQDLSNVLPDAYYSDVYAIGNEVWITSGSSTELFYNDAAGTTEFVTYSTPDELLCIHMLNSNEGYAGTQDGEIYRTTDGGANWSLVGLTGASVNSITFPPTADTGYCCGEVGNIYSITSSGTAKMISGVVSNMSSIYFPTASDGWVCGEDVIRHYTSASGQWNADQNYPGNISCIAVFFTNNNNGWIVGGTGPDGAIIHTTNGTNWASQTDPSPSSSGILNAVFFLDDGLTGWAAGNFGKVLSTTDGGNTWNIENTGASGFLRGIHFTSSNNGFIVGNNGDAYKYGELNAVAEFDVGFGFGIYPNPAVNEFGVSSSEFRVSQATVEIYDLNGRKLLEKTIPKGAETVEIDVSGLESGVYLCRLIMENKSVTKKLIIQK